MKMFLYSDLVATCDDVCRLIHRLERVVQSVRLWAWRQCTKENLRRCNERAVHGQNVHTRWF